jgi:nucleoside-triphosphatase THEP1
MGVTVLCAASGQGKTAFLCNQAARLVLQGRSVGGVAAPAVFEHGRRIGYDLLDLRSGTRRPLARTVGASDSSRGADSAAAISGVEGVPASVGAGEIAARVGAHEAVPTAGVYRFDETALAAGNAAIITAARDGLDIIAIDEVGPLELRGGGWAPALEFALQACRPGQQLIITARPLLADKLPGRFPAPVWATVRRVFPPWPPSLEA